jgi:hypothetical protein
LERSETASLLGYEDPNSSLRAFRVWEGVTPTEWRARQKAGFSRKRRERSGSRRTDIAGNGKRRTLCVPVPSNQCRYRRFDMPNRPANDIFSQTRKLAIVTVRSAD